MTGPTYIEQLQQIVRAYQDAGMPWPATTRQMSGWAYRQGLWKPPHDSVVSKLAEDLARAMREDYIFDSEGRTVRAKHAARYHNEVLWADIRSAPREHMEIAFQQRRQQIVGDCRQLKTDVDSYNDNTNRGVPIQMIFDFTDDLAELEALAGAGSDR